MKKLIREQYHIITIDGHRYFKTSNPFLDSRFAKVSRRVLTYEVRRVWSLA